MNRNLIAAGLGSILLATLAACTSQPPVYDVTPIKANGRDIVGGTADTTLEARAPGGSVALRADNRFAAYGAGFIVAVLNKGTSPADFGPVNIEASINGKKVPVLTAETLDEKVKGDIAGYLRANTRTEAVDPATANAAAAREQRFNNYGGCPAGQSRCQIFSEDTGRGYRTDQLNRESEADLIADAANVLMANQALISKTALRPMTVQPEQMAGGIMVVEPPRSGGSVDITVTFNGAKHVFTFKAAPVS